jgi:hypothetical protein
MRTVDPLQVYVSVVTLGEIRKGIECCADATRKAALEAWLSNDIVHQFAGRVLTFDADVADRWGRLVAALKQKGITPDAIDSLIAATALEHNLSVVTRNASDFKNMNVGITNPWSTS